MPKINQVKPPPWQRICPLAAALCLLALDQYFKLAAVRSLKNAGERQVIKGVLGLLYTENTGISFSLFGDSEAAMWVVSVVTAAAMLAGVLLILSGRLRSFSTICSAALILAGGVGNLLDRLTRGFVVDYIEFLFVHFAVFNFADICISCGVGWLAVWMVWEEFHHKKQAKP